MSFLDDFKEWSTAKKAISILAVCCVGILLIAMITGGGTSDKNTAPADDSSNAADEQAKGVQVRITCDGSWSGAIGDVGSQSTYDGTGDDTIDLGEVDYNIVSAAVQKQSGSNLKVEILKDGKVIKEASTSADYGMVTVTANV